LLQENAEVISFSSDKIKGISGSYGYKKWVEEGSGQRKAFPVSGPEARFSADLIANSYRNRGGLAVVFGIVFDLDAHRAQEQWKDSEGRLDWELIFSALKKEIPEFANYLCHAVRSTGGKGLALVMAITPMPIQDSTRPNQKAAETLQSRLISLLKRLGMGADEGARGLLRDFPNFNHPEKSIYSNTAILRELERSGSPVIVELHRVLNKRDQKEKAMERLYNDARSEKGLVNLVLWLMGAKDFSQKSKSLFGEVDKQKYKPVPFLSGWEVEATVRDLCILTNLGEGFMRALLKDPPTWLKATYSNIDRLWTLSLKDPLNDTGWLLERCMQLGQKTQELRGKVSFDPNELCLPEYVEDGERNAWLVRLTLIYKWHGYSVESALEKVRLRLKGIPGFETSRNCRQISNIVHSLFRRTPEMHGVLNWKDLPSWIQEDEFFSSKTNHVDTSRGQDDDDNFSSKNTQSKNRRGESPGASVGGIGVMVGFGLDFEAPEMDSKAESVFLTESRKPQISPVESSRKETVTARNNALETLFGNDSMIDNSAPSQLENLQELPELKLFVVHRNQRIGIIRNNTLLLCFEKKHFKDYEIIEYLLNLNTNLKKYRLKLIHPHQKVQALFYEKIDNAEEVFSGPSQSENLQELPELKLFVVRRNQRIGIIRNNKLLLCFTKKHYRASALTKYLMELNPHLKDYHLRLISPRKDVQASFYEQIDKAEEVFSGASICGRKMTYAESMESWREKKGIHREASPVVPVELEVPF
jgi:hypothetical protein